MKNKKKNLIIIISIILGILILSVIFYPKSEVIENNAKTNNIVPEETDELKEVKITGCHLSTYAQSSNANSFIKTINVTAVEDGKIKFVIGSIDENSYIIERKTFEIECKKGANNIELSEKRILIRSGEYLFMDLSGQDTLYTNKKGSKILLQSESNKVSGKMPLVESEYVLPFTYVLEKIEKYNALFIGNNITTQNNGKGSAATDDSKDYYSITKQRLENTFDTVKINRINAINWEKNTDNTAEWINTNLKKDIVVDLDLVVIQLGDNYDNNDDDFEKNAVDLIKHIRIYSPNAEIIWVGVWNFNEEILNKLPGICERNETKFINISDLNSSEYQTPIKEKSVEQLVNNTTIDSFIEAIYPNNEAMQIISNRIIEVLKFDY